MFSVDSKSVCTACKNKVTDNHCLTCNECDKLYHATCPSAPDKDSQICNSTFLSYYVKPSTKPNFAWTCDICKTGSEAEKVATLRQLVLTMQKSHMKEISSLTELVMDLTVKVDSMATIAAEHKVTLSKVEAGGAWADTERVKNVRASLAVKPVGQGNSVKIKDVNKFATERGIPIDSVVEAADGVTFINTPDVESRERVMQCLAESHADNEVSLLKNKLPTIAVMGVKAEHVTNQDDDIVTREELKENLFRQNKYIAPYLDRDDSKLEVVFMKPPPTGKYYFSIFIRVTPDIRLAIEKKMENKIYIGSHLFSVRDRFHVKRCNRCQGLGHYEDKCDLEKPVVCGYCAKDHESKDCPDKNKSHVNHVCINCSGSARKARGHSAFWSECPTYKEAQEKMKKTIPYYKIN